MESAPLVHKIAINSWLNPETHNPWLSTAFVVAEEDNASTHCRAISSSQINLVKEGSREPSIALPLVSPNQFFIMKQALEITTPSTRYTTRNNATLIWFVTSGCAKWGTSLYAVLIPQLQLQRSPTPSTLTAEITANKLLNRIKFHPIYIFTTPSDQNSNSQRDPSPDDFNLFSTAFNK